MRRASRFIVAVVVGGLGVLLPARALFNGTFAATRKGIFTRAVP